MNNGYQPNGSVGKPHDPPRHPYGGAEQERNFCPRCGKRLAKDGVHTCSQPRTDAPDSERQDPVAYAAMINGEIAWDADYPFSNEPFTCFDNEQSVPVYTTPPTAVQAARDMRDAAVKVCRDSSAAWDDLKELNDAANEIAEAIASLPIIGETK